MSIKQNMQIYVRKILYIEMRLILIMISRLLICDLSYAIWYMMYGSLDASILSWNFYNRTNDFIESYNKSYVQLQYFVWHLLYEHTLIMYYVKLKIIQ